MLGDSVRTQAEFEDVEETHDCLSNKLVGRTDIACDCWQPMPQRHSWAEPLENATGDSIKNVKGTLRYLSRNHGMAPSHALPA